MAENNRLVVENRKVTSENYWLKVENTQLREEIGKKINEKNVPAQTKNVENEGLLKVAVKAKE